MTPPLRLGVIGAGQMAGSLVKGWLAKGVVAPEQVGFHPPNLSSPSTFAILGALAPALSFVSVSAFIPRTWVKMGFSQETNTEKYV